MSAEAMTWNSVGRVLARPRYELIPIRHGLEAARGLPPGATVSVTCSPARGVDGTVEFCAELQAMNVTAVAHLAARRIADRAHLDRLLRRMDEAGVRHVFVVAGDQTDTPGEFASGFELVHALRQSGAGIESIGVPCYPEGHGFISDSAIDQALIAKADYADYMVSQICFNTQATLDWLTRIRRDGVTLPLYVGMPGVVALAKLLTIGMRIGIGDSMRYLRKNSGLVSGLLGGSKYQPDQLILDLADGFADPELAIAGIHLNTFNQVEATEKWRRDWLASLKNASLYEADDIAANEGG
jgi:methylenetetrahydrofolate reductase (NADPH)